MMSFSRLFSQCVFGHDEALKELIKGRLHLRCGRCGADLGPVLKGQKLKLRRVKLPKRPADVLRLQRRKIS